MLAERVKAERKGGGSRAFNLGEGGVTAKEGVGTNGTIGAGDESRGEMEIGS